MKSNAAKEEILFIDETANLKNYDEVALNMDWKTVEETFTWYKTGHVNIVYEAIDRHVNDGKAKQTALFFTDGARDEAYTYRELQTLSCRFANGLRTYGIKKGDRVFVFMPRSPEVYISILGIIRMGAIAGPMTEAFMNEVVKERLKDSEAVAIVTTPELVERIPIDELPQLKHIIIVGGEEKKADNQILYQDLMSISDEYTIEWVDRETAMLLHYTAGFTGKPKGVLQVHDAMVHQYLAGKWAYDLREGDVYWCTADPGWITGTSAGMWSPWLNGVTIVMRGGRFRVQATFQTLEKYRVNVWYSAPTALQMIMAADRELPKKYDLSKLRHIISGGEPLNPEVIQWGLEVLNQRIHDNWWMTETGACICANFRSNPIRPGSMGKPLPGIKLAIVDDFGNELPPNRTGHIAIKPKWPAMMRAIWNDQEKYEQYFETGWFVTGDSAYKDEDGYFWFEGRVDDVINTDGERVGPLEVESELIEHLAVAEVGVIGIPDPGHGEIIKAFIVLHDGYKESDELKEEIRSFVKTRLPEYAVPSIIEFCKTIPKTRSGKIMRRVLKAGEH
ncbi:MAG TPA: acetate--CoA ligase [Bacillus bacterium]|nr:acetate--CoA ligase [Bacillus sp. (in: firmicutes)]